MVKFEEYLSDEVMKYNALGVEITSEVIDLIRSDFETVNDMIKTKMAVAFQEAWELRSIADEEDEDFRPHFDLWIEETY